MILILFGALALIIVAVLAGIAATLSKKAQKPRVPKEVSSEHRHEKKF